MNATTKLNKEFKTTDELISLGWIPFSFSSHRARGRSGVTSIGIAVYSFHRASSGGYYLVPPDSIDRIARNKGVTKLRGPWSDLLRCWN